MENKWESFCDEGYYGLWAVRPVGDRSFKSQQLFHVQSKAESDALRETLDTLTRQLEAAEACLIQIANDQVELSHEKVFQQRNDYLRWSKDTLAKINQIGEEQ